MKFEMESGGNLRIEERKLLQLYTARVARLHYLRFHFKSDGRKNLRNPILDMEENLVQSASDKLRKHFLDTRTTEELSAERHMLEALIRRNTSVAIGDLTNDDDTKQAILHSMLQYSLDELFATVN